MKQSKKIHFKKTTSADAEENILPLINIVFLLLIFFLWAGTISVPDLFEVQPPISDNENPELASEMIILIGKDNRYAFENNEIHLDELYDATKQALQNSSQHKFKIKTDGSTHSGKVLEVMEILRNAGVDNTTLITAKNI